MSILCKPGSAVYGKTLLLNLEEARSIDSSGIDWLLRCHIRFRDSGGRLMIVAAPPKVSQMLRMICSESLLSVVKTTEMETKRIDELAVP